MKVYALSKAEINKAEVTTPETLGMWGKAGEIKYRIMGMPTGGYMNAGFDDDVFLYYDKPFGPTETFRFSARIRILSVGGVSTGKGVHVGAYSPNYHSAPAEDLAGNPVTRTGSGLAPVTDPVTGTSQVFNTGTATGSQGVGLFLRAES
jgi:hypothetical protein